MDLPPLIDLNDDVTDVVVVSAATSHSYTDPSGTKIFDRYFSSSSSPTRSRPSSSSSDEDESSQPSNSTIKRLDYMMQFLDRKLHLNDGGGNNKNDKHSSSSLNSLPEFIAKGGEIPMFKRPLRAAVHPGRPPSLEVRPHPLRESQVGSFLRTIVGTERQLWTGGENGVRVWEFGELYEESESGTAPFRESVKGVPGVTCMVGDEGSGVVWSGHKDGKVRCWKMKMNGLNEGFRDAFAWEAHRGPVLSLCISSYGMIFSSFHLSFYKFNNIALTLKDDAFQCLN